MKDSSYKTQSEWAREVERLEIKADLMERYKVKHGTKLKIAEDAIAWIERYSGTSRLPVAIGINKRCRVALAKIRGSE